MYGLINSTQGISQWPVMTHDKLCRKFFILLLVSFVNLTNMTVFDMFLDGTSHTYLIHFSFKCFFKSGLSRVLQVGVVPTDSVVLKSGGDTIFYSLHKTSVSSTSCEEYLSCVLRFFRLALLYMLVEIPFLLMGGLHRCHCSLQLPDLFALGDCKCFQHF